MISIRTAAAPGNPSGRPLPPDQKATMPPTKPAPAPPASLDEIDQVLANARGSIANKRETATALAAAQAEFDAATTRAAETTEADAAAKSELLELTRRRDQAAAADDAAAEAVTENLSHVTAAAATL